MTDHWRLMNYSHKIYVLTDPMRFIDLAVSNLSTCTPKQSTDVWYIHLKCSLRNTLALRTHIQGKIRWKTDQLQDILLPERRSLDQSIFFSIR